MKKILKEKLDCKKHQLDSLCVCVSFGLWAMGIGVWRKENGPKTTLKEIKVCAS